MCRCTAQVVPLDPVGLYFAMKQHSKFASDNKASQLRPHRILARCAFIEAPPPQSQSQSQSMSQSQSQQQLDPSGRPSASAELAARLAGLPTTSDVTDGIPVPMVNPAGLPPSGRHRRGPLAASSQPTTGSAGVAAAAAAAAAAAGGAGRTLLITARSQELSGPGPDVQGQGQGQGLQEERQYPCISSGALRLPDLANSRELLEELVTSTDYARAAYGYVMAAGQCQCH